MDGIISVDGVTLGDEDADGTFWGFDTLSGWHDGAAVRSDAVYYPAQQGAFPLPALRGERVITVAGWIQAPTRALAANVADALAGILSDGRFGEFRFTDTDQELRRATVRLSDTPKVAWDKHREIDYQLTFFAPDPRKYGAQQIGSVRLPAQQAPGSGLDYGGADALVYPLAYGETAVVVTGSVRVDNRGNAFYHPMLRLAGPMTNPIITSDTGAELHLDLTLAQGQWLDIDCAGRRVLANGVASRRYAVRAVGDWLAIPPGGTALHIRDDDYNPGALMTVWYSTGAWF